MSSVTPGGRLMSMESHGGHGALDMYDALRDLFLGQDEPAAVSLGASAGKGPDPAAREFLAEPAAEPGAEGLTAESPLVEALVLGHLPVQQSPWVMQYAKDSAARRGGAVALLRIREGEATIDLVGGMAGAPSPGSVDIREAFAALAPRLCGVILRVDPTTEPLLPNMPGVDALTLLTGADEAAIVGSYRTVKGLIGNTDDTVPPLRLAIMGSTTEKALAAADKIQKAIETNLKEKIEITACLARIGVGRSSLIYRGLISEDLGTLLPDIRAKLASASSELRRESLTESVASPSLRPPASGPLPTMSPQNPPGSALGEPAVTSRLGHASPPQPVQSAVLDKAPQVKPEPREASSIASASARAMETSDSANAGKLALHIPGCVSLPISCPSQPGVEFAVDSAGGLHLLARAGAGGELWKSAGGLLAAGRWAKSHVALIALAAQAAGHRVDESAEPVLHLMMAEAKGSAAFADAGILPHLLVQVRVEGRTGWYSTELA